MEADPPNDQPKKQLDVLIPQEVKQIDFYGDELLVALVDGVPYVAVRPIVGFLKIDWSTQYRRIQDDEILEEEQRMVRMTDKSNKQRDMLSLPLELLPGWIFTVTTKRLKNPAPETVVKLKRYRRECFKVLWHAFGSREQLTTPAASASKAVLQHTRNLGLAVAQMAEEQLAMQEHIDTVSGEVERAHSRLDLAAEVVVKFNRRLTAVERRVMPYECISPEQAGDIKLAVQRLGELLTRKAARASSDQPLPNYYQGIFVEIYNRTGAPRYELIHLEDYQGVMSFLEDWYNAAQAKPGDTVAQLEPPQSPNTNT